MPAPDRQLRPFCETVVKAATVRKVTLITSYDQQTDMAGLQDKLDELKQSLLEYDVALDVRMKEKDAMTARFGSTTAGPSKKSAEAQTSYQKPEGWVCRRCHRPQLTALPRNQG